MEGKLLFLDTETGGIEPTESSLFSIGIVVWENGNTIFENEIYIKDMTYKTTAQALLINNIDISQIDKIGLDKLDVVKKLKKIKEQYFDNDRMTLVGHNVAFDVSFLKQLYKETGFSFLEDFSHRMIDTSSILQYLYFAKKLEENISSSDKAFEYFNIEVEKRHTALDDCRATVRLFNELILLENS